MNAIEALDAAVTNLNSAADRLDAAIAALPAPGAGANDAAIQSAADAVGGVVTRIDAATAKLSPTPPAGGSGSSVPPGGSPAAHSS